MKQKILYLFTRTPLHVGAGSSVGAIDQPIQRERHTGFPVIPGSSIKGVMRDLFLENGKSNDLTNWLFGPDNSSDDESLGAGALQFSEAKILAFPVRSARGCFAWITSPLAFGRFARELGGCIPTDGIGEDEVVYGGNELNIEDSIIFEEYTFKIKKKDGKFMELDKKCVDVFGSLVPEGDPVWKELPRRLVMLSDGMMSFFTNSACEVAQHTRIDDATGIVAQGALFNQENVPSDALFYTAVSCFKERKKQTAEKCELRSAEKAAEFLENKLASVRNVIQIGGDAGTGLGLCTTALRDIRNITENRT